MSDVKLLARWSGWCDPCETERPLVLTETGERGLAAWLRGVGPEDRALRLTCAVCGEWQDVPHEEEPTEVIQLPETPLVAVRPVGTRQVVVMGAPAFPPYPVLPLPSPRPAEDPRDVTLALVASDLDLLSLAG